MARDLSEYTFQHNGVDMKKVLHNGTVELWTADVPDVVHSLSFNYDKETTWYDTGTTVTLGTLLTGVDLSLYSGAELTLSYAKLETAYAWADAYLYLTDGTDRAEIAHQALDASDGVYISTTDLTPVLNFSSASGTADLSIVLYAEDMNEVAYTVTGGTLKLVGHKG